MKRLLRLLIVLGKKLFGFEDENFTNINSQEVIEREKRNLKAQISALHEALATHAAYSEDLIEEVKNLESLVHQSSERVLADLEIKKLEEAGQEALKLEELERKLESAQQELHKAEFTYRELLERRELTVQLTKEKIKELEHSIEEADMHEATAVFYELSNQVTDLKAPGSLLCRLQEAVDDKMYEARGRAKVSKYKFELPDPKKVDSISDPLARRALTSFTSNYGMMSSEESSEAHPET